MSSQKKTSRLPDALDPTFGMGGKTILNFPETLAIAAGDVIVTSAHKIVIATELVLAPGEYPLHSAYGLCRLEKNGALDPSFGQEGYLRGHFLPAQGVNVSGLGALDNGKILLYGISDTDSDVVDRFKPCLTRFHENGELDRGFGTDGTVTILIPKPRDRETYPDAQRPLYASQGNKGQFSVLPDQKVLVLLDSQFSPEGESWILQLMPDGTPDAGFNNGQGYLVIKEAPSLPTIEVKGFVLQSNKIVVYGTVRMDSSTFAAVLVRFHQDGRLDADFGAAGYVIFTWEKLIAIDSVAVQADGRLVIVGYYFSDNMAPYGILMKFTANGQPDTSFNAGKPIVTPLKSGSYRWQGVAILGDGRVMVSGLSLPTDSEKNRLMVARYLASGELDLSFGGGAGWVATSIVEGNSVLFKSSALQDNARFLCMGDMINAETGSRRACAVGYVI